MEFSVGVARRFTLVNRLLTIPGTISQAAPAVGPR